ncbi:hypothetical protein CASFOL_022413 [Castilleja foliolosa]|uniref:Uncharacterized protein n=1 Tax=Castilleja foliolosa TaxID=1961234 RepID=A0ABD3CUG5_9LAMI
MGSHFVMYLAKMPENAKSGLPPTDVERVDSYAYLPPNSEHSLKSDSTATLVVFERRHEYLKNHAPEQITGTTDKQPLLETPGEVFELRKLIPTYFPYDFYIHYYGFSKLQMGEFLNLKLLSLKRRASTPGARMGAHVWPWSGRHRSRRRALLPQARFVRFCRLGFC